jgi:hypothetical protein
VHFVVWWKNVSVNTHEINSVKMCLWFFMFCIPRMSKWNQQMHKIIGKCKICFQPLHMFRQIDCHLQGVYITELQVLSVSKYTIYVFTIKVFYTFHDSRCIDGLD